MLFDDQIDLVNRARDAMRKTRRVLMVAETGSGKTRMASAMIQSSRAKGKKAMFIVPRRELLKQTAKTFMGDNIPFGYIASGHPLNPYAKTYLATTGTLIKRLDKFAPDIVVIDEAHFSGETNKKIADYYHSRGAFVLGLTATPRYPSGDGMGDCYDTMVSGPSLRWLIDNKRLSDYRLFAPSRPDLSGVKKVAGDYAKGQLADRMEHDRVLIGDAVKHYRSHAMGRLAVAYCTSRKHSQMVAASFRDEGIPAAHVDGETPDAEMFKILTAYARREILVLCNADLLLFGFDLSAAVNTSVTIECMIDLRPTMSLTLQRQKNGRVLRYKDYPAIILDHGGNTMQHGLPCDQIDWTLDAKPPRGNVEAQERTSPVRQCTGGHKDGPGLGEKMRPCYFAHPPAPRCPNCGAWYEVQSRMVDQIDGELVEISRIQAEMTPQDIRKTEAAIEAIMANAVAAGMPRDRAAAFAAKKVSQGLLKNAREAAKMPRML